MAGWTSLKNAEVHLRLSASPYSLVQVRIGDDHVCFLFFSYAGQSCSRCRAVIFSSATGALISCASLQLVIHQSLEASLESEDLDLVTSVYFMIGVNLDSLSHLDLCYGRFSVSVLCVMFTVFQNLWKKEKGDLMNSQSSFIVYRIDFLF